MAYAKKSNVRTQRMSHVRKYLQCIKSIIITVIILAALVVVFTALIPIFHTPERIIKSRIESIAADYYENYFYQDIVSYKTTQAKLEKTMEKYKENGFSRTELKQLLIYDNRKHADAADAIKKYCNESNTFVQFFPIAPYGQKDYRMEFYYSCNF